MVYEIKFEGICTVDASSEAEAKQKYFDGEYETDVGYVVSVNKIG